MHLLAEHQHVARVEVAVQAQRANAAGRLERGIDVRQGGLGRGTKGRGLLGWDGVAAEQARQRLVAEGCDIEAASGKKGLARAHGVQAANEAAQPAQHRRVIELGAVP